jgi:microcystin-dependent protein
MNGVGTGTLLYDNSNQNLVINGLQFIPTGSLLPYAGISAPAGWLLCQGQTLAIANYSNLFSVIGTTYGGNGSTNFVLPDLRGRVPIGAGQLNGNGNNYTRGSVGGAENHALTVGEMPSHNHAGTIDYAGAHSHTYQDAYFAENAGLPGNNKYGTASSCDTDNNFYYRTQNGGYTTNGSDPNTQLSTSSAGSHNHTMSISSTGNGDSFSLIQPYVVTSYIIKS